MQLAKMTAEYIEGFRAFDKGSNVYSDNPYRHEDDNREHDWEAGYWDAEQRYAPNDWSHLERQSLTCNFDNRYFG